MDAAAALDPLALEVWFKRHVHQASPPFTYTLIAGGQSNLSYRVVDATGTAFVLRRPPLGLLPPGTHDVTREHRILAALGPSTVRVPPVVGLCADPGVIGAPFYVMNWVTGTIIDRVSQVAEILPDAAARRNAAFGMVDGLAALHQLDVDTTGLGDLSRRDDYVARILRRMYQVWENTKTRDLPLVDSLHARLVELMPPQRHTGLIHSDYRLGNVMLGTNAEVVAVLDWELCTIGDVLADLAYLLNSWDLPDDPWPDVWTQIAPTRAGGFPTREELVTRYAWRTGFDIGRLNYYRAFNYWRIAVIAEGVKRRHESGSMASTGFDAEVLAQRVLDRAELADRFLLAYEAEVGVAAIARPSDQ